MAKKTKQPNSGSENMNIFWDWDNITYLRSDKNLTELIYRCEVTLISVFTFSITQAMNHDVPAAMFVLTRSSTTLILHVCTFSLFTTPDTEAELCGLKVTICTR